MVRDVQVRLAGDENVGLLFVETIVAELQKMQFRFFKLNCFFVVYFFKSGYHCIFSKTLKQATYGKQRHEQQCRDGKEQR